MRNYTDIEESKRLIELGLDSKTADYIWVWDFTSGSINGCQEIIPGRLEPEENDIPAWSLDRLLGLIPTLEEGDSFDIYKCIDSEDPENAGWYIRTKIYTGPKDFVLIGAGGGKLGDAVFDAVCQLLEKKVI